MWLVFILLLIVILPEIVELFLSCLPDRQWKCVKTIRLTKLRGEIATERLEHCWYVKTNGNKAVFALIKNKDYAEVYKEKTVRGKIQVNEDTEVVEPVLRIFQHVPVFECGTFTPVIAKTKYIFYVPKGTVYNFTNMNRDLLKAKPYDTQTRKEIV